MTVIRQAIVRISDICVVNRAFEGPKKPPKKADKPREDIESRYEERAERNAARLDEKEDAMDVEEMDALPVKSLTGELRYLSAPKKASGMYASYGAFILHI